MPRTKRQHSSAPVASLPSPLYRLVQIRQSHLSGPIVRYELQTRIVELSSEGAIIERWETVPLMIVAE